MGSVLIDRKHGAGTQFPGHTHYGHHVIDGNRFIGIDDNGWNIGLFLVDGGLQGLLKLFDADFGLSDIVLFLRIDRHNNVLFGLRIALGFGLGELDDIWVGQGGYDQEEHEQDEQDVIQCIREHFGFAL
jgi:hypothetical protein